MSAESRSDDGQCPACRGAGHFDRLGMGTARFAMCYSCHRWA